jgi:hypothetical protein
MVRTTTVMGLLIAAGLIVAMLPAQESVRRRPSVYGGAPADAAPAPEPGLLAVESAPSTAPPTALPPARATTTDSSVAPAGILGRARRNGSNLSSQLRASGEAASQEYTPTPADESTAPEDTPPRSIYGPAEVSPPAGAIPMPSETTASPSLAPIVESPRATPVETEADIAAEPTPAAESPSDQSGTRSVLKRMRTAPVEEPAPAVQAEPRVEARVESGPPPRVSVLSSDSSRSDAARSGTSSRRTFGASPMPLPKAAGPTRSSPAISTIDTRAITDVAVSGRSPSLRIDVAGPSGVSVGKAAGYLITVVNESDKVAQDVQIRISLPGFVAVSDPQPTDGEATMQAEVGGQSRLVWSIPSVAGRGHQSLRLALVASEGQAFDLGVEWASRPSAASATIQVRQPQLQLSLSGPADMTFGDQKTFTLSLANPGNGDAEDVMIQLSTGQGRRQQIDVGTLPAGQRKDLPVQIVAAEAGEMEIHAIATGEGGLSAEAAGKVIVRKAELAVIVEGPQLKFAGAEAAYTVVVQNTGNAPADNVQIAAALPQHAKYQGGIDGAAATSSSVKWKLASLPAGTEKAFELRLVLQAAGENRVAVEALAAAGVAASGETTTTVEAAADLKLVVNDPAGPIATSEFAVYHVQVMNRGSDAARQVKIVMQFGDGIEPVGFDGCEAKIVPGQVVCHPLQELGAGEQVTIKVKARADKSGTHQFRVEVTSDESETRLVTEGTTKFFADAGRTSAASTARKPNLVPQGGTFQR